MQKKIINRKIYIDKITPYVDTNIAKILVGQRRVGKSFIMLQLMEMLKKKVKNPTQIIYINKEDIIFDKIKNYEDLVLYVTGIVKTLPKKEKIYLFVDEVQEIENFQMAIRSFLLNEKFDVYLSGSNSKIVSGDLATLLSGRYVEIPIYPLNFQEFTKFTDRQLDEASLNLFLKYGGMPFIHNLSLENDIVLNYTKNIYNTILLKDVVARYGFRNVNFLERLVLYLADNTGNLLSAKNISTYLKNEGVALSPSVVLNYLDALESAFFVHNVKRFDIKGKKIFKFNSKYYLNDVGIRNAITGYKDEDIAKIIENVVYSDLISKGFTMFVGDLGDREIDFYAKKGSRLMYVQVSYLLSDKATREREFGNLLGIDDNYEKIVVSMDPVTSDYKGIRHIRLLDFLQEIR